MNVAEPTIEEACQIMQGIAKSYAQFHGVAVSPEIARQCVILSERYITDRFPAGQGHRSAGRGLLRCEPPLQRDFPDGGTEKEQDDYELELRMLTEDTENEHFERLAEIRSKLCRIAGKSKNWKKLPAPAVTMENLARIIELWTKIPQRRSRHRSTSRFGAWGPAPEAYRGPGPGGGCRGPCHPAEPGGYFPKRRPVSFIFGNWSPA